MREKNILFTPSEMVMLSTKHRSYWLGTLMVPLILFYTALQVGGLGLLIGIEYEMIYRVFEFITAGNDYWSPGLMGLTAAIMIVGFHTLAEKSPNNITVVIINNLVKILIPHYLIGAGLLIACILYADGLSEMLNSDVPLVIGELPDTASEGQWLDWFYANVTNPLAVAFFSLGVGGLAVVNLFVAAELIKKISKNISNSYTRIARAKTASNDYRTAKQAQKDFGTAILDEGDLLLKDENIIAQQLASEVESTIHDALLHQKIWLKEKEIDSPHSFEPKFKGDPKQVAKSIEKIQSITHEEILQVILPHHSKELLP